MNKCGIYFICNTVNNYKYIGSSVQVDKRWCAHKNDLRGNRHSNCYLQNAWNLYGEDKFVFEFIESCEECKLIELEQKYLDSISPEYNISKLAHRVEMNEDTRKRISEACKGRISTFRGRKHSEYSRKLISDNHADVNGDKNGFYGKKHTDDTKLKLSESKKGVNNHFYGKKRSSHSQQMLGEGNSFYGKVHTDKTKSAMSLKKCKLSLDEMRLVVEMVNSGTSQAEVARQFNCSPSCVNRIVKNRLKVQQGASQ